MRFRASTAFLATGLVLFPVAALASGAEDSGANWKELGSQTVNFAIYVALIVFLAKKPLLKFFQDRRDRVTAAMDASAAAAEEAAKRLAETTARMEAFDAEREAVLNEFRALGEAERDRIVAQAEADAAKLLRDAEATAERELKLARAAVESKIVDLALSKAEAEVQATMNAGQQARLIDAGIAVLGSAAN